MARRYITSGRGIYIVTTLDKWPCKIGFSTDLLGRLSSMQSGNWHELIAWDFAFVVPLGQAKNAHLATFSATSRFEAAVHRKLKELDLHLNNEWFDIDADAAMLVVQKVAKISGYDLIGLDKIVGVDNGLAFCKDDVAAFKGMVGAWDAANEAIRRGRAKISLDLEKEEA